MINFDHARENMVSGQILPHKVTSSSLLKTMSMLPRENFTPHGMDHLSYSDQAVEVFKNRYLLAPMVFARLLQEANIQRSHTILDIGFGTGYSSLALSFLAHKVVGLESHKSLVTRLENIVAEEEIENLEAVYGPLEEGCKSEAPYDIIIFEGAIQEIPTCLKEQTKDGGRLVMMKKFSHSNLPQATIMIKKHNNWTSFHPFEASCPALKEFTPEAGFIL